MKGSKPIIAASGQAVRENRSRVATVYDAVAGRTSYEGFRKPLSLDSSRLSLKAVPADEVLGRRRRAENRRLNYDYASGLPDSDLLIATHQYAANFFAEHQAGPLNYHSLDESALLAVGVLLEELIRSTLSDTGHLALGNGGQESLHKM